MSNVIISHATFSIYKFRLLLWLNTITTTPADSINIKNKIGDDEVIKVSLFREGDQSNYSVYTTITSKLFIFPRVMVVTKYSCKYSVKLLFPFDKKTTGTRQLINLLWDSGGVYYIIISEANDCCFILIKSLSEISTAITFADFSHFVKYFKILMDSNPEMFRNSTWYNDIFKCTTVYQYRYPTFT